MNKVKQSLLDWATIENNTSFNMHSSITNEYGTRYYLYSEIYDRTVELEYIRDTNVYYLDHERYEGIRNLKKALKEY